MGQKILVVDDNDELRTALCRIFSAKGFETLTASGGKEAFKTLEATPVDILLTDIRMQEGNGVDLIKNVTNKLKPIPLILVMTGFSDVPNEEIMKIGARFLFRKPFSAKDVIEKIKELMGTDPA